MVKKIFMQCIVILSGSISENFVRYNFTFLSVLVMVLPRCPLVPEIIHQRKLDSRHISLTVSLLLKVNGSIMEGL